jgi:DNA-binding NarL/FixJ family response regulator
MASTTSSRQRGAPESRLIRNRYRPLKVAGKGGQGEVLKALDLQHDRPVAIKVRSAGRQEDRQRLLSEARILLNLEPHPGLPLVRDDFFVRDHYYLVSDWIEGESLSSSLECRGDPGLPIRSVLGYLDDVAAALDHIHGQTPPIVHGDVKPANMILTPHEHVVLVDFGVARGVGDSPGGGSSPGFAAPETGSGASTAASDVFSLAATAYALLTGSPPKGQSPRWEGLPRSGIGAIQRAIRQALSTNPARRPRRASELVEQLRNWLEPELDVTARPNGSQKDQKEIAVMLVDDHPLWRETLRKILEHEGSATVVAEAADGSEVLETARATRPDVVIMDMHLPGMSGIEATRALLAERPDTKVLVLSSLDEKSTVLEAVEAGASGYLVKTVGPFEVADAVRRVHAGELVFPPALAGVMLTEFRRLARKPPKTARTSTRRR